MGAWRALPALLVLLPGLGWGAEAGRVEGLQSPAWLERDGRRSALVVNAVLQAGDRLATGPGARALLRLEEGSHVKLGENAEFHIREFEREPGSTSAFRGFLNVLKGAFRYTSTALSRTRQRDLRVRIAGVTAGIRGTDVWGKAAPDRDIVCLIEGDITVRRGEEPEFRMSEPLSFYIAPKGQPALPVAPVDPEQLRKWAEETDLRSGEGVVVLDGEWTVHLSSHQEQRFAQAGLRALGEAGIAAGISAAVVNDRVWYRLSVSGFPTLEDARAFAAGMDGRHGITEPWVDRR